MNTETKHWIETNGQGGITVWCSVGAAREHIATFKRSADAGAFVASIKEIAQLKAERSEMLAVCAMALEVINRHDNCKTGCETTNDSALYGYTGEDNLTDPDGIKSIGDRLQNLIAKHSKV